MSIPAAFFGVVLIWATTPLAIKWSGEAAGYLFGVGARMLLGLFVCLVLIAVLGRKMRWHKKAMQTYVVAGLGLWGAMTTVYWGAQFISSGLVSVIFGFTPIISGVMAAIWLKEKVFTPFKILGMLLGITGLAIIFFHSLNIGQGAVAGLLGVITSVTIHSLSMVGVKKVAAGLTALETTTGSLLIGVPLFLLAWGWDGAQLPVALDSRSMAAIVYLGIVGSVVGFILYYYVLHHVEVNKVALIPLATPILAIFIGQWINDEVISVREWTGIGVILLGLSSFQWGGRRTIES